MMYMVIIERLKQLIVNEARSCSMDFECETPEWCDSDTVPAAGGNNRF